MSPHQDGAESQSPINPVFLTVTGSADHSPLAGIHRDAAHDTVTRQLAIARAAAAGGLAWCLIVPVHEARMRADSLAGRLLLLCCAILDAACPNLHQGCPNLHQVQPL